MVGENVKECQRMGHPIHLRTYGSVKECQIIPKATTIEIKFKKDIE